MNYKPQIFKIDLKIQIVKFKEFKNLESRV